jgi:surface antigen
MGASPIRRYFHSEPRAGIPKEFTMLNKTTLLLAAASVALGAGIAFAQPAEQYQNASERDAATPYAAADMDHTGYGNGYNYGYDDGYARRARDDHYRGDAYRHEVRYDRGAYYYGDDCRDNAAAGTLVGAAAGGVIGNQFGRGDGRTAATVGGVILGGLAGNSIASDMDCGDRRSAFASYGDGFDGNIGQRYRWHNDQDGNYGSFTPVREYSRDGNTCRDFTESSYRDGNRYNRSGTACRRMDGNWYME